MNEKIVLRPGSDRPRPRKVISVALGVKDVELAGRIAATLEADQIAISVRAPSIPALLPQLGKAGADAVVADPPGKRAAELRGRLEALGSAAGHAPTLLLCEAVRRGFVRTALKAGAHGILLLPEVETGLPAAIRAACAGYVVISAEVAYGAMESAALSHREKQVLGMVVMGLTNRQISEKLFLAESTVKGHLSSTFDKLGVSSRSEAAAVILDPNAAEETGIPQLWKVRNGNGDGPHPVDGISQLDRFLLRRRKAS
jgi:DNA-binding NarL/FixJ family response regulator